MKNAPYSESAEKAVLGGILCDGESISKVYFHLKPEDFYNTNHERIFSAMILVYESGMVCDLITVRDKLESLGMLNNVGGDVMLADIADSTPSSANIEHHAKIVKEKSALRCLIEEAQKIIEQANDKGADPKNIPTRLAIDISHDAEIKHVSGAVVQMEENISRGYPGLPACYDLLAKTIRKVSPGHLFIVGAYTSTGKSAFLVDLICRMYRHSINPGIAIFSTEMSCEQYLIRCLSNQTGVPGWTITENKLYPNQIEPVEKAKSHFKSRNLYLYDNLYKIEDIERTARLLKEEGCLDILAIDYIQNLWGEGSIYERMSKLSQILQYMAKELNITVIALSQVSNQHIRDGNNQLHGYKGAGEIAASADLGIELVRDAADKRRILFQIKKNRHGPTDEGVLEFDIKFTGLKEIIEEGAREYGEA